jgi:hypothetical protein
MEFKSGVLFIRDRNPNDAASSKEYDGRNIFEDTKDYINSPYYKLYSVACMGNSKDNIEVFHDITNPYEFCVEVADNQERG